MVGPQIDFDTVLELCGDQHRRIVLATLAEEQRPLTMNDLTKTIIKHNQQASLTEISDDVLHDIRIQLYHVHIPKLEEENLIEYDKERQLVDPTKQIDQIQPLLSNILDIDPAVEPPTES